MGIYKRINQYVDENGNTFTAIPETKTVDAVFDNFKHGLSIVGRNKMGKYNFEECENCSCIKPNCGSCPYRFCEKKDDYDFVTKLCEDLRDKKITDRQFTIRYKKRFGRKDC